MDRANVTDPHPQDDEATEPSEADQPDEDE
jgi:hypothetical protein